MFGHTYPKKVCKYKVLFLNEKEKDEIVFFKIHEGFYPTYSTIAKHIYDDNSKTRSELPLKT